MAELTFTQDSLKHQFHEYLRVELTRAPGTISMYMHILNRLEGIFDKPIEEVTAEDLRSLKRMDGYKSSTIRGRIQAARQFHLFGVVEGLWPQGPVAHVRAPSDGDSIPSRPLSLEQAGALLNACERPQEYRLVYLGLYAGTRIGDSAAIREGDWKDDLLWFRRQKSRRFGEVPVHPVLASVREMVLAHSPYDRSGLKKAKDALEERVGFHFIGHQLRKTFAATLYDNDVPDEVLKDLLGHKGDVTRLYAPVTHKKRLDAIMRLEYPTKRSDDRPDASGLNIPERVTVAGCSTLYARWCGLEQP